MTKRVYELKSFSTRQRKGWAITVQPASVLTARLEEAGVASHAVAGRVNVQAQGPTPTASARQDKSTGEECPVCRMHYRKLVEVTPFNKDEYPFDDAHAYGPANLMADGNVLQNAMAALFVSCSVTNFDEELPGPELMPLDVSPEELTNWLESWGEAHANDTAPSGVGEARLLPTPPGYQARRWRYESADVLEAGGCLVDEDNTVLAFHGTHAAAAASIVGEGVLRSNPFYPDSCGVWAAPTAFASKFGDTVVALRLKVSDVRPLAGKTGADDKAIYVLNIPTHEGVYRPVSILGAWPAAEAFDKGRAAFSKTRTTS